MNLSRKNDEILGCCFSRTIPFVIDFVCSSLNCCFNYRNSRVSKMAKFLQPDKKSWSRTCQSRKI